MFGSLVGYESSNLKQCRRKVFCKLIPLSHQKLGCLKSGVSFEFIQNVIHIKFCTTFKTA